MCKLLDVPRSSFYERRSHRPSQRALVNAILREHIRAEFKRSHRRYGSPRITRALRKRNAQLSRKQVARLMRADGLVDRPKKRFRVATQSDHGHPFAPNLLKRDFTATDLDLPLVEASFPCVNWSEIHQAGHEHRQLMPDIPSAHHEVGLVVALVQAFVWSRASSTSASGAISVSALCFRIPQLLVELLSPKSPMVPCTFRLRTLP